MTGIRTVSTQAGITLQGLALLVRSLGSFHKAWVALHAGSSENRCILLLLLLLQAMTFSMTLYMFYNFRRPGRRNDICFFIGSIEVSIFNLLAWHALPDIQREKKFIWLLPSSLFLIGLSFPPAYALIMWTILCPTLM